MSDWKLIFSIDRLTRKKNGISFVEFYSQNGFKEYDKLTCQKDISFKKNFVATTVSKNMI